VPTTIYHGNCLDVLPTLPKASIDCIFVDPPYNTTNTINKAMVYDRNDDFARKRWKTFHAEWDTIHRYIPWATQWLTESARVLTDTGTIFVCGSFHNIPDVALAMRRAGFYTIQWVQWCIPNSFPNLSMTKQVNANQTIIWARKGKSHYYDKEAAKRYNDGKNLRDYWIINNDTTADRGKPWKAHPSKKPVGLVARALDIALPKHTCHVLDFFAGGGSTGAAAQHIANTYGIDVHCTLIEQCAEYVGWLNQRFLIT